MDHHISAVEHQYDGQGIGEDFEDGDIFHPHSRTLDLGIHKFVVFFLEFLDFKVLFGKGFYHTVSAHIFLYKGIQGGKAVAVPLKGGLYLFGLFVSGDGREGQHYQHAQGKLGVYGKNH